VLSRLLTRKEQFAILALAGAIALGGVVMLLQQKRQGGVAMTGGDAVLSAPAGPLTTERAPATSKLAALPSSPSRLAPESTPPGLPAQDAVSTFARKGEAPSVPPSEAPPTSGEDISEATSVEEVAPPPLPPPPEKIYVTILGAVRRTGQYSLSEGARISELITRAGGLLDHADISSLNLSAKLIDGTTLTIPEGAVATLDEGKLTVRGVASRVVWNPPQYARDYRAPAREPVASAASTEMVAHGGDLAEDNRPSPATTRGSGLVNLNTATQAELETLPGIGPALAQRIIEYRTAIPFASVEDLDQVSGFGPKRMESLRPLVTVN